MKRFLSIAFLLVVISLNASGQAPCGVHCGTERWKVKTLTDSTVGTIDPAETPKTITNLRGRTRPAILPNTTRVNGAETFTFKVKG